ncbi:MAG: hypothetical protein M1813_004435 [Trichoglossum hirsutum]|nr:MAG: hypothetical protein M1813_004435 [Trichoglossum hirsutum]
MLDIVKSSADGPMMIDPSQWIDLPVGKNLNDHCRTEISFTHPNVTTYDFDAAYKTPIPADASAYLDRRSGILAQSAPNIGPMFWEKVRGADGTTRKIQWTSYVQGSVAHSMTLSQYIGTGTKSRGRMTITPFLDMVVSTAPYLHDSNDVEAVIQGIERVQEILSRVPGLTFLRPEPGQSAADYVHNYAVSVGARSGGHWFGSATLELDDGRKGGIAVVDSNTKVYGTDNLFVADASIFSGPVTANPSAQIIIAAERAAELILASTEHYIPRRA